MTPTIAAPQTETPDVETVQTSVPFAPEAVPSLRELEAKMAQEIAIAAVRQKQKSNFVVRLLRELGVMKEPAVCKGVTRQAVPCKRLAIRDGFCRLHSPVHRQTH